MRKLLVTGGAGFIGCNFVHYWCQQHPKDRIVVLDALTYAGDRANLDPVKNHSQFHFVHGSICDQALVERLLKEHQLDTIVHFAAESHVDRSITGPDVFIETNVIGTHSLLKAARKVWLEGDNPLTTHRFHHVSTDEVYGTLGPEDPAFTERTPYAPNSPYAASKAASDHLVRAYHHTYGLQVTTSNCSNNYGPYQYPEKLIPLCIINILQGKPLPIYGDGQQVRDWLHVEDHCRGIEAVLGKGKIGETYNIGSDNEQANLQVVTLLCQLVDKVFSEQPELCEQYPAAPPARGKSSHSLTTYVTDRPGHDRRYAINAERIAKQLGFRSNYPFELGLEKTIQWYMGRQ